MGYVRPPHYLTIVAEDPSLDDNPAKFKDAPIGLQLVGRSQEEEAVLRMCEIVDDCLRGEHK